MIVRAKKHLGQHFLTDKNIAKKITESLTLTTSKIVLEIGPGMGVLTDFLIEIPDIKLFMVEIDTESIDYLHNKFPDLKDRIINEDFLRFDLKNKFQQNISIIGNFPYNISSQILFKVLDNRDLVFEVVGMFQKEVAQRIASGPGTKDYGILSVLCQAYFTIDYLFTVNENVFNPPPKVKSAVIRLENRNIKNLGCNEKLFKEIVKKSFNQRRKMLRNSLKEYLNDLLSKNDIFNKRPEQLSYNQFIELTNMIESSRNC